MGNRSCKIYIYIRGKINGNRLFAQLADEVSHTLNSNSVVQVVGRDWQTDIPFFINTIFMQIDPNKPVI